MKILITDFIKNLLSNTMEQDQERIKQELDNMSMDIFDENLYVIDYMNGWVLSLDRVRTIKTGSYKVEEYLNMKMLEE